MRPVQWASGVKVMPIRESTAQAARARVFGGQAGGTGTIGVKGVADGTGSVGVWGQSAANTGVYGQSGSASGAALWGKNTAGGIALRVEGNAVQSLNMNGLPKAMAYIVRQGNGLMIERCYNGVTGATTGNCGFKVDWIAQGAQANNSNAIVNFGFSVDGRFVAANVVKLSGIDVEYAFQIREISGSVVTLLNTADYICSGFCGGEPLSFFIFVY